MPSPRLAVVLVCMVCMPARCECGLQLSLVVPEPPLAAPFNLVAFFHNVATAARLELPPETITIEVFSGVDAECGAESAFNTSEIHLSPVLDHDLSWHVSPVSFAVGSTFSAGVYLACIFVEGGNGLHLASASSPFQVMSRLKWTLSACFFRSSEQQTGDGHDEVVLGLDVGRLSGIQEGDLSLLEGARVEMEVDGKMAHLAGGEGVGLQIVWRKARTRVKRWSDMKQSMGNVIVQERVEGQGVVAVRHHTCASCIGNTPQELIDSMAQKNPDLRVIVSRFYGDAFSDLQSCPLLSARVSESEPESIPSSHDEDSQAPAGRRALGFEDEGDVSEEGAGRGGGRRRRHSGAGTRSESTVATPACYGNFSRANVVEALESDATLLVLGCLHASCGAGSGAGDDAEASEAAADGSRHTHHGEVDDAPRVAGWQQHGGLPLLGVARFIADDVEAFMEQHLRQWGGGREGSETGKPTGTHGVWGGRTLCVSLIGVRLAPREASARAGLHTSWAADASQMIRSVRELERTSGSFGSVYVVSDGAFPEEAQLLISELRATPYQVSVRANTHRHTDTHTTSASARDRRKGQRKGSI